MNQLVNYLNQTKTESFKTLLFKFIDDSGMKDSDVYNDAEIDRRVFSKVRCKHDYNLSRMNILKLSISLKLNLSDTLRLLNSAGYSLSTTDDFDLVLRYCIDNKIFDKSLINEYLYDVTSSVLYQ